MMVLTRIVFLVVLFAPRAGMAWSIQGYGAVSCGRFAQMYKASPEIEDSFFDWAQGFWAGVNATAAPAAQRDVSVEPDKLINQKSELRRYCGENPLKNYVDGVVALYWTMPIIPQK